jgi:hypothetical protein
MFRRKFRLCRTATWLLSTIVALGCSERAEIDEAAAPLAECTTLTPGAWWNQEFPEQRGFFHVEVDVTLTISDLDMDAVVGIGRGAVTDRSGFAAAVRFGPYGGVDALDGAEYRADEQRGYVTGSKHGVRFDVDTAAGTYSAWLRSEGSPDYFLIARDLALGAGAAVGALDHIAATVDPATTAPATFELCGAVATPDTTTAEGCTIEFSEMGFVDQAVTAATGAMIVDVTARVDRLGMDAVFGVASGPVDSFNDFAASVRFWTDGTIQARDGDAYRAEVRSTYEVGVDYRLRFVINVPSRTYSVFLVDPDLPPGAVELAHDYRFRPQQAGAASLDHIASIVDSGGRLEVCRPQAGPAGAARFAWSGAHTLLALPGGGVLVSDYTSTTELDADGRKIRSVARGGLAAMDAAGHLYLVRHQGEALEIDRLSPSLQLEWSTTRPIAWDQQVRSVRAYASGTLAIALLAIDGTGEILTIESCGSGFGEVPLTDVRAASLVADGFVVAAGSDPIVLRRHAPDGTVLWQRAYPGNYSVNELATDADGNIAMFGYYFEQIDFGTGPLPFHNDVGSDSFVAAFTPAGAPRFAEWVDARRSGGLSVDHGRVAFARQEVVAPAPFDAEYSEYYVWNANGARQIIPGHGLSQFGYTASIALGPRRLFAAVVMMWPDNRVDPHRYTVGLGLSR